MQRVADQGNSSAPEQADFPVRLGVSQLLYRVLGLLALTLAPLVALTPLPTRLARAAGRRCRRAGRRPTTPLPLRAWLGAYTPLLHHPGTLRILAVSFLRGVWWIGLLTYLGAFLGTAVGLGARAVGLVYALVGAAHSLGSVAAGRGFGAVPVRLISVLTPAGAAFRTPPL